MKGVLKRTKKGLDGISDKAPDYEGFVKGSKGYVHIRCWHKDISSDLSIYLDKVDQTWIENDYNAKKFADWLKTDPKNGKDID